jgi:hypothetical protein
LLDPTRSEEIFPMQRLLSRLSLLFVLAAASGLVIGCGDEANQPAAKTAETALGINPEGEKKSTTETRDVTEVKETKVIDNKTGAVISDKREVTPVKIDKVTNVKTDVNVKAGETKSTGK